MNKPLKFKDIQVNQYYWDNYNNEYVFINKKSKKGSKPKLVYVFADTAREYKEDRFYIKKERKLMHEQVWEGIRNIKKDT